jgi:hypothetical protein
MFLGKGPISCCCRHSDCALSSPQYSYFTKSCFMSFFVVVIVLQLVVDLLCKDILNSTGLMKIQLIWVPVIVVNICCYLFNKNWCGLCWKVQLVLSKRF